MNAGDLDREIILQTATATQDAETGEQILDWTTATAETIWAAWRPTTARELAAAQQQRLGAYIDGRFRIYDKTPRPSPERNRVYFDGRIFDLRGVKEIGRGEGLELEAAARGEAPA